MSQPAEPKSGGSLSDSCAESESQEPLPLPVTLETTRIPVPLPCAPLPRSEHPVFRVYSTLARSAAVFQS